MNKPIVSIITITFNCINAGRRESLIQCIESVQNQNYENIEHIIIDGASTDGTLEVLQEFEHLRIYSEPDNGVYNAFNKGVMRAEGKYVVFMNSDDYFANPDAVRVSVENLEQAGADYSYGDVFLLNEENPKKSQLRKPQFYKTFSGMPFCHQSMFCKTDVIKSVGMFNENQKIASDYELLLALIFGGYRGVRVKSMIAVFRCGGVSTDIERRNKENFDILKKYFTKFTDITDEELSDALKNGSFPLRIIPKLIMYLLLTDRLMFILTQIRRFMFQLRTSKSRRTLKICGYYFIKPETM